MDWYRLLHRYVNTSTYVFVYLRLLHCDSDVNECHTLNGGCDGTCHNSLGSFSCTCDTGYTLGSDGTSCIGKVKLR